MLDSNQLDNIRFVFPQYYIVFFSTDCSRFYFYKIVVVIVQGGKCDSAIN